LWLASTSSCHAAVDGSTLMCRNSNSEVFCRRIGSDGVPLDPNFLGPTEEGCNDYYATYCA
jgi:hypothetical protein